MTPVHRGILLLVLALFHRPILATVLRLALIKFVARDHISLNLRFSGSFFTNLTVSDISAKRKPRPMRQRC